MDLRRSRRLKEKSVTEVKMAADHQMTSGCNTEQGTSEDVQISKNFQSETEHTVAGPTINRPENRVDTPDMDTDCETVRSRAASIRSTSSRVRQRMFEARAATMRAEIEVKRVEAQRLLIEAQLQEEQVAIHCETNSSQASVLRWVDQTSETPPNTNCAQMNEVQPSILKNKFSNDVTTATPSKTNPDLSELTKAITDAFKITNSSKSMNDKLLGRLSAKDLPIFSGDPLDWLRFKNVYTTTTDIGKYTDAENIARLQKCLQGEAWESVAAQLMSASSAKRIMKILELRFGQPDLILNNLIVDMKRTPKLMGSRSDLIVLATKVTNCVAAINTTKQLSYLHSPELTREIISKLTEPLIYRWIDYFTDLDDSQPRLTALADYLMMESERLCRAGAVELPQIYDKTSFKTKRSVHLLTDNDSNHNITSTVNSSKTSLCHFCRQTDHILTKCTEFCKEDVDKRWKWVCDNKFCFKCLNSKHRAEICRLKIRCKKCQRKHHTLLHKDNLINRCTRDKKETSAHVESSGKKVYLKILPVDLEGPRNTVRTYALLDEGSTVTLLDRQIADEIGAEGPLADLVLQGAIGESNIVSSRNVSLTLRSPGGNYILDKVRTVDKLSLPVHTLNVNIIDNYLHLKDIPLESFSGPPKLLIGQDFWHLIVTRETREGKKNEPVASRTQLGWVLHGFVSTLAASYRDVILHIHEDNDDELNNLVRNFFKIESIGVDKKTRVTIKDQRALQILNEKSKKVNGRWETGLLWKHDRIKFPNNKRYAVMRLHAVEKKMDGDCKYANSYIKEIDNILQKGYAKEIDENISVDNLWYLPHFGVTNINKPNKLRVVFDAKTETQGVSMNSELLTGPDLLNSLVGVLFKFRERAVAVTGDIREMFLQIKIIEEDRNAQHFLWRSMDRVNAPRTYQMTSMIFGATSSPCTATYIIRRNADDYKTSHPRAVMGIKKRHYVDDYLDSVDTEEEMKQLILDVEMIHQAGGFEIRGWTSNKPDVLPRQQVNENVVHLLKHDEVERTLGLNWRSLEDTLEFDLSFKRIDKQVIEGLRKPTKREMLKFVMSVFDPLGFLCPFLIRAKILLQEVWRSGVQWDRQINDEHSHIWFKWLRDIRKCRDFSIPRCYGFKQFDKLQLHIFVDASEQAYAAVAYLRRENHIAFVMGKSRVAPIKSITVPRLELQSALLGSRIGKTIVDELDFNIERRYFWTDSKTVYYWIQNNPRQQQPFVTHRLYEIDELTELNEWRWLPGKINVADEATRCDSKDKIISKWINGPDFLKLSERNWPKMEHEIKEKEQHDVLDTTFLLLTNTSDLFDVTRFSNWRRLVRTVAQALLFIDKCRRSNTRLTPYHERRAEILIFRQIQRKDFNEDIITLMQGQILRNKSKLRLLSPKIDNDGVLRLESRIEATKLVSHDFKNPIILDGKNYVVKLMIEYRHRKLGHHSHDTLINELRQQFYIFGLRTIVKSIIRNCVICKARRSQCEQPMMARLPPSRLEHHCKPFSYCGIDFFGPMIVKIGRRREKRWGVIFTCLSIRAVHIELAASLSTDSTILAIRRMAARRGLPIQIYSDNGTNFHAADKELRLALKDIYLDDLFMTEMTARGIDWRFNPPDAPHMGGVWERLIKSIKIALKATLNCQEPREEVLTTLLMEAENIVNSRPLTHVTLDPHEEESLTPNHFLVGSSNGMSPPGHFTDDDMHLRKQWRISQQMTDKFWSRWVKEYLPSLHIRKKWNRNNSPNLCIGDIVLIADSTAPRNCWPRGKIIATTPGHDGRVRIVDVLTKGGVLRRPATKIVTLLKNECRSSTLQEYEEEIVTDN